MLLCRIITTWLCLVVCKEKYSTSQPIMRIQRLWWDYRLAVSHHVARRATANKESTTGSSVPLFSVTPHKQILSDNFLCLLSSQSGSLPPSTSSMWGLNIILWKELQNAVGCVCVTLCICKLRMRSTSLFDRQGLCAHLYGTPLVTKSTTLDPGFYLSLPVCIIRSRFVSFAPGLYLALALALALALGI